MQEGDYLLYIIMINNNLKLCSNSYTLHSIKLHVGAALAAVGSGILVEDPPLVERAIEQLTQLGGLFQRISHWLILREGRPITDIDSIPHFTMRRRRLRTLLHCVDADGQHVEAHPGELGRDRILKCA